MMNYIQLYALTGYSNHHTPDAISNCMALQPQSLQSCHLAKTTVARHTKPHFDHLRLKPATGLLSRGASL